MPRVRMGVWREGLQEWRVRSVGLARGRRIGSRPVHDTTGVALGRENGAYLAIR